MIETTYITLEIAATSLGTDANTLLIAAVEGRLQLFGFLGKSYEVCYMRPVASKSAAEGDLRILSGHISEYKWFDFVPIIREDAAVLLRKGEVLIEELSEINPGDGGRWCVLDDPEESSEVMDIIHSTLIIKKTELFVRKRDIESIRTSNKTPEPDTIPTPAPTRKSDTTKRNDTLHVIIAALAKMANINLEDRDAASRIEGFVRRLGASISSGTTAGVIQEVLERIPESIERRQK